MAPLLLKPNRHGACAQINKHGSQYAAQLSSLLFNIGVEAKADVIAGPVVHACSWRGPGSADLQAVLPSGEGAHGRRRLDPALRHQTAQQLRLASQHWHAAALAKQRH